MSMGVRGIERMNIGNIKCPVCGSGNIEYDYARGEYYCSVCGYVLGYENIFSFYDRSKKQQNHLLYNIDKVEYEVKTENLKGKFSSSYLESKRKRMMLYDKTNRYSKFLLDTYNRVEVFSSELGLGKNDKHLIKLLARKIVGKGYRFESAEVFAMSLVMYYFKKYKKTYVNKQRLKDIVGAQMLSKVYRVLRRLETILDNKSIVIDVEDVWYDASRMFNLTNEQYKMGLRIIRKLKENKRLISRSKFGLVSGIMYIVSRYYKLGLSQIEISERLGVTEVTLRNTYKKILWFLGYKNIDEFLSENFIFNFEK